MKSTFVRPATGEDIAYVAAHLRASDIEELKAQGMEPLCALKVSQMASDETFAGYIEGVPALIFGHGGSPWSDEGNIWALGTDQITASPREILVVGRLWVDKFLNGYKSLFAYCYAENTLSLNWLRHLGFTWGAPEQYGPKGKLFYRVTLKREEGK